MLKYYSHFFEIILTLNWKYYLSISNYLIHVFLVLFVVFWDKNAISYHIISLKPLLSHFVSFYLESNYLQYKKLI
jgi:hypothetical protein